MNECIECGAETGGRLPVCDDCAPDDTGDSTSRDVFDIRQYAFPETMSNAGLWLNWAYEMPDDPDDDPRKIPRAPWRWTGRTGRWAANKDPENWTDHGTAREWRSKVPGHELAYYLPGPEYSEVMDEYDADDEELPVAPRVGLIDYDDVLDPKDHECHPLVAELLEEMGTFAELSPSWTGIHQYGCFTLPDGVKSVKIDISTDEWPDAEIEVYDGKRYTTVTGDHIRWTADDVTDIQAKVDEWVEDHAERERPSDGDEWNHDPERERDWSDFEPDATTSSERAESMQDIIYALDHLDAERVGKATIVHRFNDDASTSDGVRAFYPEWGRNSNGRANIIKDGIWNDTGGGGYGGPAVMAAVDLGLMQPSTASPDRLTGGDWADAVDHLRDLGFDIPDWPTESDDEGGYSTLVPAQAIENASDESAREVMERNGFQTRSVEELWDRLDDTVKSAMEGEETVAVRSPTGSGKTHLSSTTEWKQLADVTGDQPVILLEPTRDARDEAFDKAQEAGVDAHRLRGQSEACPTSRGDYDPDDEASEISFRINGKDPSMWFSERCHHQNIPFSVAHSWADDLAPDGLPCSDGATCPAHAQHEGIPRDDDGNVSHDVIIATHNFAFVPGLRNHANVILDEEPDFEVDMSDERVRAAVNAYLAWLDGPIRNFSDLAKNEETPRDEGRTQSERARARARGLTLREHRASVERRMENLLHGLPRDHVPSDRDDGDDEEETDDGREDTLDGFMELPDEVSEPSTDSDDQERTGDPPVDWYFANPQSNTLAPAIARAVWAAEPRASGRIAARVPYEPPRFERSDDDGFNRVWVTVVLNQDYELEMVHSTPDFSSCRSVVGLDAHVNEGDPSWMLNVGPMLDVRRVLDSEEEALYRRFTRGLEVVQVGEATNPVTSRYYWDEEGNISRRVEMVTQKLRDVYGERFRTGITANSVEEDLERFLRDAGADDPETMHYGATKSLNTFAGEDVGLVAGAIDPGDEHVLNLLAALDMDATPETADEPCSACEGSDHGCKECEYTGFERESGREFTGPDADIAQAALESVRSNEVAQAVGRYARDPKDDDDRATVYVMTDAIPDNMVDIQVPGVVWSYTENQQAVLDSLEAGAKTTVEIAEQTGLDRSTAYRTLEKAADEGLVEVQKGEGEHGANLYAPTGDVTGGVTEVGAPSPDRVQPPYEDTCTWSARTTMARHLARGGVRSPPPASDGSGTGAGGVGRGEPPDWG